MRGGVLSNQTAAIESQPTPQTQDVPGQTLREAVAQWLNVDHFKVFATITLKKSILNDKAGFSRSDEYTVDTVANRVRSTLARATGRQRHGIHFAAFYEEGVFDDRPHIHSFASNVTGVPIGVIEKAINKFAAREEWVMSIQLDVRPIYEVGRLIDYSLDTGFSALLVNSCSIPKYASPAEAS